MRFTTRRKGLTLIELTVVLLVLAAVAAILVPRLTGYGTRAHGASGATNIAEVVKNIGLHEANNNGQQPNNWDSMISETSGGIILGMGLDGGDLATITLTDTGLAGTVGDELEDPLIAAGITNVINFGDDGTDTYDGDNATFDPYTGSGATGTTQVLADDGATSPVVAALTQGGVTALGLPGQGVSTVPPQVGDYVVFGLGLNCDIVGRTMIEAPIHYPEDAASPETSYLRFVAIYRIQDGAAGEIFERAKFVTVAAVHDGGVSGLGDHIGEYFEAVEANNSN